MNLSLGRQVKQEVSGSYKQKLYSHGGRVLIKIPNFYASEPLKVIQAGAMTAAMIPLDPVTTHTLTTIENFVEANVDSPKYSTALER